MNRLDQVIPVGAGFAGIHFRLLMEQPMNAAFFSAGAAGRHVFFSRHSNLLQIETGLLNQQAGFDGGGRTETAKEICWGTSDHLPL